MRPPRAAFLCIATLLLAATPAAAAEGFQARVEDVTTSSARVVWTATQDPCFEEYRVQVRPAGTSTWRLDATIGNPGVNVTWVTSLNPGTTYEFRIVRVDCHGAQSSNTVTATTEAAPQPATGHSFGVLSVFILGVAAAVAAEIRVGPSAFRAKRRP